jgi:DNA-binding FrmR family transcriptional regulator
MDNEIVSTEKCHIVDFDKNSKVKKNMINRLSRIEGQIRGIKKMIDEDTYCDDVLNQITSVKAALSGVTKILLEKHIESCVVEKLKNGEEEVMDELMKTIGKMLK